MWMPVSGCLASLCRLTRRYAPCTSYLHSLGRFGSTAFITPMYGVSELAQAFCRVSAVHGGIYMLRQNLTSVNFVEGECKAAEEPASGGDDTTTALAADGASPSGAGVAVTLDDGTVLRGRTLVANPEYVPQYCVAGTRRVARALVVTTSSLVPGSERLSVVIPPGTAAFNNPHSVQVRHVA